MQYRINNQNPTQEAPTMNNTPIETITYVFGRDVKALGEGELIDAIKRVKQTIADYEEVGVESTRIADKIEEAKTTLKALVERLDALDA